MNWVPRGQERKGVVYGACFGTSWVLRGRERKGDVYGACEWRQDNGRACFLGSKASTDSGRAPRLRRGSLVQVELKSVKCALVVCDTEWRNCGSSEDSGEEHLAAADYLRLDSMVSPSVYGRTSPARFCHLSCLHPLLLHALQPLANLQLVKRCRMPAFPAQVTKWKAFCQEFCHLAEPSAKGSEAPPGQHGESLHLHCPLCPKAGRLRPPLCSVSLALPREATQMN